MSNGLRVGVTGMPRSGTSLMMMICRELGCVMYGHAETPHFPLDFNPDGYWELNDYEIVGARHEWNGDTHDRVVKAFPKVMREFPIDKYIVMVRDIHDAAKSFQKVFLAVKEMTWCGVKKVFTGEYDEALFAVNINLSTAMNHINKSHHSYITVDFEELVGKPKKVITKVAKYLDIGSGKDDIDDAVKLVRVK